MDHTGLSFNFKSYMKVVALHKNEFIWGLSKPALPNKLNYDSGVMQKATHCKLALCKVIRREKVSNLLCEANRATVDKIKHSEQVPSSNSGLNQFFVSPKKKYQVTNLVVSLTHFKAVKIYKKVCVVLILNHLIPMRLFLLNSWPYIDMQQFLVKVINYNIKT